MLDNKTNWKSINEQSSQNISFITLQIQNVFQHDDQNDNQPFDRQRKIFKVDRIADKLTIKTTKRKWKFFMTSTGFTA